MPKYGHLDELNTVDKIRNEIMIANTSGYDASMAVGGTLGINDYGSGSVINGTVASGAYYRIDMISGRLFWESR